MILINSVVILVIIVNVGEVRSDCDDFLTCVGDFIGGLIHNDSKNVTVKTFEVPDVISAVRDVLSDISHLFEDKFENVTKESSLVKNLGNKTEIHIETFKIDYDVGKQAFELINETLSDVTEESTSEKKSTNEIGNSVVVDLPLELKENQTVKEDIRQETKDLEQFTDTSFTTKHAEDLFSVNYTNASDKNKTDVSTATDDSIKLALSEEFLNIKASLPELGFQNFSFDTSFNFSYFPSDFIEHTNVTYDSPFNVTFFDFTNTSNFEKVNVSNVFVNIPENIASNYKITYDTTTHANTKLPENNINANENKNTNLAETVSNETTTTTTSTEKNNERLYFDIQFIKENEIIVTDDEFGYDMEDDNSTDYLAIDYVEYYKDTTNEDVDFTPPTYTVTSTEASISAGIEVNETNGISSTFPWIAAVFIKNNDNNQFEYICDGSLVSERVVVTAARCVIRSNATEDAGNMLVILGKRSLQSTGDNEKVLRVKSVKLHENFTAAEGMVDNDLAIIVLADPVAFNDDIRPVTLKADDYFEPVQSATTGWHVTGPLTPIYFQPGSSKTCKKETDSLNTFCATFGDDITTCPSYGGLFLSRRNDSDWSLQGIASGNPTNKGACFIKSATYTNIGNYYRWIMNNIELNKV